MSRKAKPKRLSCRWCGETIDARNGDSVSHWSHSHPAKCPYRQDRMPMLNGVRVGDHWRNLHTGGVVRVVEIRLGGEGTYVDREPVFVTVDITDRRDEGTLLDNDALPLADLEQVQPSEDAWVHEHPMWSLSEHWDPITRPGEYPVPWEIEERHGYKMRSALDAYRCPGYRGSKWSDEKDKQYWHAYHGGGEHGVIGWEATNVLWQVDPDAEPTLIPGAAPGARRTVLCLECGKEIRGTDDHVAGPRHIECADDSGLLVVQLDTYGEEDVPNDQLPPSLQTPEYEQEALF